MPVREGIYGLLAEFNTPGELVHATEQAHEAGYRRMECYTPYPVEEAAVALRFHKNRVPLVCLLGGLMGVTTAFLMETWIAVWSYPLNIAGRPLFSWPAFIIPAYEWTILFSGLSAAFGMLALNGLPQLYHPLFNAPELPRRRDHRQVFPVPGGNGPEVFDYGDARVSGEILAGIGGGGGAVMRVRGSRFEVRGKSAIAVCALAAAAMLAGCRQDMQDQPKFIPQRGTDFYADGRSVRPQVENTVARGQLHQDAYFYTGLQDGKEGNVMPFPVTMEVLERGQERFNIYCTPCHSRVGNGAGMIVSAATGRRETSIRRG